MKLSFKHLLAKLKISDDDLLPCVDTVDAMHMTKCMQSAGILAVGVTIVAVDLAQNLMAIHKLSKQTQRLRRDLQTRQLLSRGRNRAEDGQSVNTASTHKIRPSNTVQPGNSQLFRIAKEVMRHRHAIEEVAVVEYIEAIVPFVYSIYLAIMVHLLNAKYNENLDNITEQQTNTILVSTVTYTALEVLSLVHDIK